MKKISKPQNSRVPRLFRLSASMNVSFNSGFEIALLLFELVAADFAAGVALLENVERGFRRRPVRAGVTGRDPFHQDHDAENDQHPEQHDADHPEPHAPSPSIIAPHHERSPFELNGKP